MNPEGGRRGARCSVFFLEPVGGEQLVTSAGVTRWAPDDPLNENKSDSSYFYFKPTCSCEGNIPRCLLISETGEIHFGGHKSFMFILPPQHQQADVSQLFSQVFLESADVHAVERPCDTPPQPLLCHRNGEKYIPILLFLFYIPFISSTLENTMGTW